ncbi:MAG: hypothetical protein CML20_14740 [Rheinheimera sp.]|nr:hypothetical protein [Rheinheimera sp.]
MPVRISSEQAIIIKADPKSNIRVMAVPGSGKSTVLVHRIGYLMKSGIKAEHILGIMFNDSAVENFKDDLEQLEFMALPEVKTYHSYARKLGFILEKRGILPKTNFTPNAFSYKNFYREALNQFIPVHLHKMLEVNSNKTVTSFIRFVELCKSSLKDPKVVFEKFNFPITHISFIDAFLGSEKKRKEQNIQFFSDLIYDLVLLSKEKPEAMNFISNRHDVVLVDEYQDANAACHELIKLIAGTRAAVNVVGDDDQTIYDFTGASPEFLKDIIARDFQDMKTYSLTSTFRYGHNVALIANNIISNNDHRIEKLCISGRPDLNTTITTTTYEHLHLDIEQTQLIDEIKSYILAGGKYCDIAILVRNYSSTFSIEMALLRIGIPYFISKESKTVMHSFDMQFLIAVGTALCPNSSNEERSKAITSYLKCYLWIDKNIDLSGITKCILNEELELAISELASISAEVDSDSLKVFKRRIKAFVTVAKSKNKSVEYRVNRLIKEAGILTLLNTRKKKDMVSPLDRFNVTLNFFISLSDNFQDLLSVIEQLKALTEQSELNEGIQFCTLHKSKGLARPFVILAHCEEGVCPSIECGTDPYLVEVERRLFYVGVTRARNKVAFHIPRGDKELFKSFRTNQGYMNDIHNFKNGVSSRFVYESNVLSAVTIGVEIMNRKNQSSISSTGNRHIYNQYLQALGLSYRISGIKEFL